MGAPGGPALNIERTTQVPSKDFSSKNYASEASQEAAQNIAARTLAIKQTHTSKLAQTAGAGATSTYTIRETTLSLVEDEPADTTVTIAERELELARARLAAAEAKAKLVAARAKQSAGSPYTSLPTPPQQAGAGAGAGVGAGAGAAGPGSPAYKAYPSIASGAIVSRQETDKSSAHTSAEAATAATRYTATDLKRLFPKLEILDEAVWEKHADLTALGLDLDDAPPIDETYIRVLETLSASLEIEDGAGITLLTLPKGLNLRELMQLAHTRVPRGIMRSNWDKVISLTKDAPLEKTCRVVITNNILKGSRNLTAEAHQKLVKEAGCEMPEILPVATLAILTYINSDKNRGPTSLYNRTSGSTTFTRCLERIDDCAVFVGDSQPPPYGLQVNLFFDEFQELGIEKTTKFWGVAAQFKFSSEQKPLDRERVERKEESKTENKRSGSADSKEVAACSAADLKKLFPKLEILDETVWQEHADLTALRIGVKDAPPLNESYIPVLKTLFASLDIEGGAGITLLTIPKGFTLKKLAMLAESPKKGNKVSFFGGSQWTEAFENFFDRPVAATYRVAITNNILKGSKQFSIDHQKMLAGKFGCQVTGVLDVATLAILTYITSRADSPTCLLKDTLTRCFETYKAYGHNFAIGGQSYSAGGRVSYNLSVRYKELTLDHHSFGDHSAGIAGVVVTRKF